MRIAIEKESRVGLSFSMAGDEGFEPPNAGTRNQCLTTWRIPNGFVYVNVHYFTIFELIAGDCNPVGLAGADAAVAKLRVGAPAGFAVAVVLVNGTGFDFLY
jgi:hypothetical protein